MAHPLSHPLRSPRSALLALAGTALVVAALFAARAQVEGERGIAAVVSSADIDIGGIEVDVRGDNAEDARLKGWREAQRKAWEKAGGPPIPEGQLEGLVSAVVIERERIGPRRYIATLGVIFDRARAGSLLGSGGQERGSAPMMLIPVTVSAGSALVYEKRNPWQRAWAEFQAGTSRINYVRPSGAGGESLLINFGQTGRRSRTWWRNILDQFEAADVLVPIANLDYQYPGGPVTGRFTARYGPSNRYLGGFTLTADNPDAVPAMLEQAVRRFDRLFERALKEGKLRPDPTLDLSIPDVDPALRRLMEIGLAAEEQQRSAAEAAEGEEAGTGSATPTPAPTQAPQTVSAYTVQFATPDGGAFDATLAAVRATPGVRGAAITSTAVGGTSVMSVSYGGTLDQLAAALRARGFAVTQGGNALSIRR